MITLLYHEDEEHHFIYSHDSCSIGVRIIAVTKSKGEHHYLTTKVMIIVLPQTRYRIIAL